MLNAIRVVANDFLNWLGSVFSGKKISRALIVNLTESINDFLYYKLQKEEVINDELRQHIIYVVNNSLQKIKDYELSYKETKDLFDNLRRLSIVIHQYNKNQSKSNRDRIIDTLKEANKIL